ncbi:hypothetical protein ACIQFZ_38430 [Streptomyces sp. NPDC093064]|uniref:hypothetical protein n=1 Tax=Streptomyces sp. NPDC093064 TaxID=3366020 RepID=UPI0038249D0F
MDVDDLTDALAAHTPDPEAVLAALQTKRRKRARRRVLATGGAAVVAAGVITLWSAGFGTPTASTAVEGASGCVVDPFEENFTTAREKGFSVVLAKGVLTGRSASDSGPVYAEMRLTDVRTLSGPEIRSGSTVWLDSDAGPDGGPVPGTPTGSLWARDGSLFGIIAPQSAEGAPEGSYMRVAPVVDGQVVLSTAGCWKEEGRPSLPYSGPLAEIPGSDSYRRAAEGGFQTVPLSEVERLASH